MGYTHYFHRTPGIPHDTWAAMVRDVRKIYALRPNLLCVEYDEPNTPPVADDELIQFNGKGALGHETFLFPRVQSCQPYSHPDSQGRYFECCKTERKPYDEAVVAVLLVLKCHLGDGILLSSDGRWEEEWLTGAWEGTPSGVALASQVLEQDLTGLKDYFGVA